MSEQDIQRKIDTLEEKTNNQLRNLVSKMNEIIKEINKIEDEIKELRGSGASHAPAHQEAAHQAPAAAAKPLKRTLAAATSSQRMSR